MSVINLRKLSEIANGMQVMAKTYPNDIISNNLARVSELVASYGATWSTKMTPVDLQVVRFYLANKK
jgi:hypothetical protein